MSDESQQPPPHGAPHATYDGGRGMGPFRLFGLGLLLLLLGLGLRWTEDATAPWVNLGEADMTEVVTVEDADAGRYRLVTSGPTRPALLSTVCRVTDSTGGVQQTRGDESNGQDHFGVSRITSFEIPGGTAQFQCGRRAPDRGAGLGRFQVVAADGAVSTTTSVLLWSGVAGLVCGVAWFGLRLLRERRT